MKPNERLHALKILTALFNHKSSLVELFSQGDTPLPMTKELCFGVCRHYVRLTVMAEHLVDKRPKDLTVWIALLMGFYQLHYMRIPDYAVVQETVALLTAMKKVWAKGLVNAVLRHFCRQRPTILATMAKDDAFIYGHPRWLLARLQADWPQDWQAIAMANDQHPPMVLRVNQAKVTVQDYLQRLINAGINAEAHPIVPSAIILTDACEVDSLPNFREGWASVQDSAAQLAVSLLDLAPGLRVLDACCAPGGKTGHLLESEPGLAECVALDVDERRLQRVEDNLTRLGLQAHLIANDALKPEQWWDKRPFDRILLDAPCSATGVIRRHADIKLLRTAEDIEAIAKVQRQLLHSLWPLLAPGGLMVYATCSIMKIENEKQVAAFIAKHQDCKAIIKPWPWGRSTGYGQQIIPGEHGMDGFFYCVLSKK